VYSGPPVTATTLVRETGDVLLMDDGFTLIEEDGTLAPNLPTIELFTESTPTTGTWVLSRYYLTNARTDGVLRSPLPSNGADESAYLTLVTTTPLTQVSFEWGVLGSFFGDINLSDVMRFYIDDVLQLETRPPDTGPSVQTVGKGTFSFVVPAGTYALRWRWQRTPTTLFETTAHAWITALITDPTF
jgi:hypothetical protein